MNDISQQPDSLSEHKRGSRALRILLWIAASLGILLVLAGLTITIALKSARVHRYVLNKVQAEATDSLGVPVDLQNFTLHLSTLSLDLYGLTVHGAAPYANPPLMQVDHASAGVRIVSVLGRKWYLDRIQIDRPIVRVFVDAKGVSNIPTLKSSGSSSSNTSVFDLGIRHALLDKGELYYNDKKSVLDADLHDLQFRSAYDSASQKYSGTIAYSDGHLVSGTFNPIPHALQASFDATPSTFHLTSATLSTGASQVKLTATLNNYSVPVADGQYDITADGKQFQEILKLSSVPTGTIHASGSLHYQQMPNRPLLDALMLKGDLSSNQLDVKTPSLAARVSSIAAHYSLSGGNATLQDFRAGLLGGELTASGTMTNIGGDSRSAVKAGLRGISLAQLQHLAGPAVKAQPVSLTGKLDAEATGSWGKTFDDLVAHADAGIHGQVNGQVQRQVNSQAPTRPTPYSNAALTQMKTVSLSTTVAASPTMIPINAEIHGDYAGKTKQVTLKNSFIRTPQTNLTLNGTVSDRSSLAVHLQADDLREVESIANLFRTAAPGQSLQPLSLAGTATFQGSVEGSVAAPHLTGQFTASNLKVSGSDWKVIRTGVDVSPSMVSLQHADLEPASHGKITLNATAALTKWSFTSSSAVQVDLDASQLSVAEVTRLAGQQIPVTGTVNANLKLHGTELNPVGNGRLSVTGINAYDQPIQSVNVTFAGTGDDAHAELAVDLPTGSLHGKVSVRPKQKTYAAELTASDIHLDKLQALKTRNINATGVIALNAKGQGSFDNPQLDATLQIPQLVIQQQTITGINLQMNVADHLGTANLTSSAVNTSIRASAKVNLVGDYQADASLDTQSIPLQPLLAVYAPAQASSVTGQTEVHATLHGPLKRPKEVEAHVIIPILKVAYGSTVQLAAAAPIHVDYKNGVIDLQRSAIKGTDTDLQFQGSIPTQGNAQMALLLQGTVDLQLAQLFVPDIRSSGQLKFNINSYGANGNTGFGGNIDIVDANYSSGDLPVGLQHANGTLTLSKDRLSVSKFQGTVGGGTLTAQGGVALQPSIQFDLGLAAQNVRILYPQGVRENVDANIRLAGTTDNAVLGGSVNLSDVSFTQAFDLNDFISQFSGGVTAPPSAGLAQNIQLNLAVHSSNDVNLVSRTLSVNGSANLQVRGTAANPVILGRVNLNNGDIILNGTRFLLNGGTIAFVNPSETEPVVNVSINTTIQQYDIGLRFNGPIAQLRTEYSSDPALPAADIINLLAFGQTTEAASTFNPESVVASQVSSQVTSRLSKVAGISQLSISPVLASGTAQGPPGANITIQQRVTGNLFVTFSSNVATTQSQTIQGQYQISPRVAVSATRDQNGGVAVDALIKKSW